MNKQEKHKEDKENKNISQEASQQNECHCEECHCENSDNETCCCQHEENEITMLKNQIKELENTVLRSQAELLNYRKRKDEETSRILKYAEEDVLKGFLPILDNFERAITMDDNNFGDETSKFLEGFRMVYNQTKALLEKFEVKEIESIGKEFDPAKEQAIATEKDESKPSGTVLKVYQKGYMYKDKVLRLAMVIVNE